jgi:hypothetical protein
MALSDHHDVEELDARSDRWGTGVCLLVWFIGSIALWIGVYQLVTTLWRA